MKKYIRPTLKDEQTAITAQLMTISEIDSNLPDPGDTPTPGGGGSGEGRAPGYNIWSGWDDEDY